MILPSEHSKFLASCVMRRAPSRSGERSQLRSACQNRIPIRLKQKCGFDLFMLPDECVVDILESWLESEYWLTLDDALYAKELRERYLRVIAKCDFASLGWSHRGRFCADLIVRWCRLRQVSLFKLYASSLFIRRGNFPWKLCGKVVSKLVSLQCVIDTVLMDTWISDLLQMLPRLQDLHIISKGFPFSSKLFRTIARHCRSLSELRLFNLSASLSPPVGPVIRNCGHLTSLEVFHCVISDADSAHISTAMAHLAVSNRESESTLTALFLRQLACRCPLLESVSVEQGWGAETLYTPYILRTMGAKLKLLSSFTAEVGHWSPAMFLTLVKACAQLREVSLCGCNTMPGEAIHSVLFSLPHLESLTLSGHATYNGELCASVSTSGTALRFLSFIEFTALTNKGLSKVLQYFPNLRAMNLSSLPHVNLNILSALVLHNQMLERLYFTRCCTRPYTLTKKRNTLKFSFDVEIYEPIIS